MVIAHYPLRPRPRLLDPPKRRMALCAPNSYEHSDSEKNNLGWNPEYATAFLIDQLENERIGSQVAIKIEKARRLLAHYPDPEKALNRRILPELSKLLFADKLNAVAGIRFSRRLPPSVSGRAACLTAQTGIVIELNDGLVQLPESEIIATLVHHLIHAYFIVACGEGSFEHVEGKPHEDGKHFAVIMHKVKSLSVGKTPSGHTTRPLPLSLGHTLRSRAPQRRSYPPYSRMSRDFRAERLLYGGRDIRAKTRKPDLELQQNSVAEWYRANCQPLLKLPECTHMDTIHNMHDNGKLESILRKSSNPTDGWVELIWDDKSILFERIKLERHYDFHSKFFAGGHRWLEIPHWVDHDLFRTFYAYLSHASLDFHTFHDPARCCITDIQLLHLAHALPFDALASTALTHLRSHSISDIGDPLPALRAIYTPPHVPAELRDWAISHLLAVRDPTHGSVLRRLHSDPGPGATWRTLLDRSAAAREDNQRAGVQLLFRERDRLNASSPDHHHYASYHAYHSPNPEQYGGINGLPHPPHPPPSGSCECGCGGTNARGGSMPSPFNRARPYNPQPTPPPPRPQPPPPSPPNQVHWRCAHRHAPQPSYVPPVVEAWAGGAHACCGDHVMDTSGPMVGGAGAGDGWADGWTAGFDERGGEGCSSDPGGPRMVWDGSEWRPREGGW